MSNYSTFRSQFPSFRYNRYELSEDSEKIKIKYYFEIEGLSEFSPEWTIKKSSSEKVTDDPVLQKLVFSLGMVELISYWKITCSPNVTVLCGSIDHEQEKWWKTQYYNGLGEFFYINGINADFDSFMKINSESDDLTPKSQSHSKKELKGCLIPVGGGKDSIVTLNILSEMNKDNACYLINKRNSIYQSAYTAGFSDDSIILSTRTLDPEMIRLNSEGYLNGHTPFSAIVAFSAVIAAYINSKKYVVLSNEASANESTVRDSTVNHQYSKSFEFEKDFAEYEEKYIDSGVKYFSLLRPWSEFQIAKYFSELKNYHSIFRSCNKGSKKDIWCGNCSKCLFVSLILSPFLSVDEITDIIGRNMFDDKEMLETFKKLIGIADEKPFECVGSRDEVNFAVSSAVNKMLSSGQKLPYLFEFYKNTDLFTEYKNKKNPLYEYYNEKNNLPEEFDKIMRNIKLC